MLQNTRILIVTIRFREASGPGPNFEQAHGSVPQLLVFRCPCNKLAKLNKASKQEHKCKQHKNMTTATHNVSIRHSAQLLT